MHPTCPASLTFRPHHHLIHLSTLKLQNGLRTPSNVTHQKISLLQELMGLLVLFPTVCFSSFFFRYLPDRRNHRSPPAVSSSEQPLRSTSIVSTDSSTQASGLERHPTASTVATTSSLPTAYSSISRDKDIFSDRNPVDRGDSYSSKLHELSPGPAPLCERQQSEPARSETTARSRLASEIERLKNRDAIEYMDDDYYDDDDEYYSEEESLDSFVNFSLLSNIAVWLRDQIPRGTHVKGSIPYPRAFTGKDIVVCPYPLPVRATSNRLS